MDVFVHMYGNHLLSAYNDQPTSNLIKVELLYINPWLGLTCLIWFLVFANYCSDWNNLAGRSLANIPPSERPKAKPSRKIDGKGAKKSQLQAALQQHSQQLAQLQQLQQLNQQLQQQVSLKLQLWQCFLYTYFECWKHFLPSLYPQVQQQRQLKQQNQATLAALQQNAVHNQQQLADLQRNVTQLQVKFIFVTYHKIRGIDEGGLVLRFLSLIESLMYWDMHTLNWGTNLY